MAVPRTLARAASFALRFMPAAMAAPPITARVIRPCVRSLMRNHMYSTTASKASISSNTSNNIAYAALKDDDKSMLEVTWGEGGADVYPYVWLRDNCQCPSCFHPHTLSRVQLLANLDRDVKPKSVQVMEGGLGVEVVWCDGHYSSYTTTWLQQRSFSDPSKKARAQTIRPKKTYWKSDLIDNLPQASFPALMDDDAALLGFLRQVEVFGLVVVRDTPTHTGVIQRLSERAPGYLKRTHYGMSFTVQAKADPNNLAYTANSLNLHSDLPVIQYKPGVQLLHCIKQAEGEGGDNMLVDSFAVAEHLRAAHPHLFHVLASTPVDFVDIGVEDDRKYHLINQEPMIGLDDKGEIDTVNFNHMIRDSYFGCEVDRVAQWYDAMITFHDLMQHPQFCLNYKMAAGDMLVFDNNRVLHGRMAYRVTGGERHLEGGYWDWDELRSRRRVLEEERGGV